MDLNTLTPFFIFYLVVGAGVIFLQYWLLYTVIRLAVRRALREHERRG